jgi:uncharacterized protein YbjT (DUF2867 family)
MILVTGAGGNVGTPVVAGLMDAGAHVCALSRDPGASAWPEGVDVVQGDLSVAESLRPALEGVDTVFLIWRQETAFDHEAALRVIASEGRRVVYLSSLTVLDDLERQLHPMSQIHADIEAAMARSGGPWTSLRSAWFATNALGWAEEIRNTGEVRAPFPQVGRSPIVAADIASVAVRILLDPGHDGATYVLTGPNRHTLASMIEIIGEAIGRPIPCRRVSREEGRQRLIDGGASEDLADAAIAGWERLVDHPEPLTDTVAAIAGRPPTPFSDWVRDHVAAFR